MTPRKYCTEEERIAAKRENVRGRAYYWNNVERYRAKKLAYYYANKAAVLARQREYKRENALIRKISDALDIPMSLARKKLARITLGGNDETPGCSIRPRHGELSGDCPARPASLADLPRSGRSDPQDGAPRTHERPI